MIQFKIESGRKLKWGFALAIARSLTLSFDKGVISKHPKLNSNLTAFGFCTKEIFWLFMNVSF